MNNRFYTMEYIIFQRKYSKEKEIYCKNLQEKIPTKKKKMNKSPVEKPLDTPSENDKDGVTVEVGCKRSDKDIAGVAEKKFIHKRGDVTKTGSLSLSQAIDGAVQFGEQYCVNYAGDKESYKSSVDISSPLIEDYYGIYLDATQSVLSTSITVGNSTDGFGLFPGLTKEQRFGKENFMKKTFSNMKNDMAGAYYLNEPVCQQLDVDQLGFVSGDGNLIVDDLENDWSVSSGIFQNKVA